MHTGLNTCTETTTATAASSLQSFAAAWVSAHELQLHHCRRACSFLLPYSQAFNSSSYFFSWQVKAQPLPPRALLSVSGIVWSCCSDFGDKHMIINKMLTHLYFSKLGYFWQTEAWLSLSIYQDCVITLLTSLNKWPKPVGFKSWLDTSATKFQLPKQALAYFLLSIRCWQLYHIGNLPQDILFKIYSIIPMGVRSVSGQGWQQLYVQNVPTYWTEGGYKQISSATGPLHIRPVMGATTKCKARL